MAMPIESVRPGDLITADLINRLIALVNKHEGLLDAGGTAVTISQVLPPVARVGEELKVFGSGLEAANLQQISVEDTNVPISQIKPGSSGNLLIFDVPALLVPPTGKTAVVTVQSRSGASAFGSFHVLPAIVANLEASFQISRTAVSPDEPLQPNTAYEFTYAVEAFTSRDETYLLEPRLIGAPSDWSITVKDGVSEILIPRSQPTPSTRPVVVVVTTGATGAASLTLGIRAKNFAGVTGSSMAEDIAIGTQPGAPNLDVEFLSPTVLGSVQKFGNGSLYVRIDSDPSRQFARVNVDIRFKVPGIYTIQTPVVSDPAWSITVENDPLTFDTTGTPNAIRTLRFTARAAAGAADADLEIPVTGADSLTDGSFRCKLKLRSDPANPNPL
jgi:hypothetical protein